MKYLPLYYKWMESGWLPDDEDGEEASGLCSILGWKTLKLFAPGRDKNLNNWYWGYDGTENFKGTSGVVRRI